MTNRRAPFFCGSGACAAKIPGTFAKFIAADRPLLQGLSDVLAVVNQRGLSAVCVTLTTALSLRICVSLSLMSA